MAVLKPIIWVSVPEQCNGEEIDSIKKFLESEFKSEGYHTLVAQKPITIKAYGVACIRFPFWMVRLGMWAKNWSKK